MEIRMATASGLGDPASGGLGSPQGRVLPGGLRIGGRLSSLDFSCRRERIVGVDCALERTPFGGKLQRRAKIAATGAWRCATVAFLVAFRVGDWNHTDVMSSATPFSTKLDLVLKALSMSRGRLAADLGVDKSLVGRWASGAVTPSAHNLENLTRLVASRRSASLVLDAMEGKVFVPRL